MHTIDQDLGTRYAHHHWSVVAPRPSQLTARNIWEDPFNLTKILKKKKKNWSNLGFPGRSVSGSFAVSPCQFLCGSSNRSVLPPLLAYPCSSLCCSELTPEGCISSAPSSASFCLQQVEGSLSSSKGTSSRALAPAGQAHCDAIF